MLRRIIILLTVLLFLFPSSALADEEESGTVYQLLGPDGETVAYFAGVPQAGDEYISGDNGYFRVVAVDPEGKLARTQSLGSFTLPDVSWLNEDAQSVSTNRRAVAIYCTHSDESYEPGDGSSSLKQRGGIYDVAEAFKKALEEKGITVYYSDENHYPHDAGAYRRSRATAAALVEEGVDAVMDVHRDGIPNAGEYESEISGKDVTKVRLLVGRSNQNADANKAFAAQIKAVADKIYPGLIKDIYIGKGSYNQDLMSQAVLLEFGTHKSEKKEVLASTSLMADVINRTLYGGVTGAGSGGSSALSGKNAGAWKGIGWLIGLFALGALVFAFAATGNGKEAVGKWKRTFQEMTGGLFHGKDRGDRP